MAEPRPGSDGEHELQERYDTFKRAAAFYDKQMLDHLNPLMKEYIARQEMAFIATADSEGECDASFRAGPAGFVRVLDDRTVMYPEYRGNGVMASLGNISENGHVGILFVDFFFSGVGLHINGRARIVEASAVDAFAPLLERMAGVDQLHEQVADKKKTPERWVVVEIVEAYIHCSKHIPLLAHRPGDAGIAPGSGDFFRAKHDPRPWAAQPAPKPEPTRVEEPEVETIVEEPEPVIASEPVAAAEPEEVCKIDVAAVIYAVEDDRVDDEASFAMVTGEPAFAAEPEQAPAATQRTEEDDELDFLVPPTWGLLRR
jgi:predicted pyridoxine 5'-phosphate oxidase superfamily flavin-nucleotide-binding protein